MSPHTFPSQESTRQALLTAASEVFAEQGFQVARIRDIAALAQTNLSAINYHFGSKQGLYQAVLEHLATSTIETFPLLPENGEELPPEEQLRHVIRNLLRRFISPQSPSLLARLIAREMSNPTGALDELVQKVSRPQFMIATGVVARVLGPDAGAEHVQRCALSVFGQCILYLFARPVITRLNVPLYDSEEAVDALADHIYQFSLAALEAFRDQPGDAS